MPLDALGLKGGEVVWPQIGVRAVFPEDVVNDHDEAVGHGHQGLQAAAPPRQAPELRP